MSMLDAFRGIHGEMTEWRHTIHAWPELAFEEQRTSDFVAAKLTEFGIEIDRGLAGTGVVGTIRCGSGTRTIGLRADLDALPIEEANDLPYRSQRPGLMHACGHDGHTTMLLGAAKYLAKTRNFDGTVHLIFQPAEENEGGARVMIEQGLFHRFPVEAVFGMHNKPGIPVGKFAILSGPMLASYDIFEIAIHGTGTHAALPNSGVDAIVVAGQVVGALQTLVRSNVHPVDCAVVSVTQIHGGDTWNVIPATVVLRGTARFYKKSVQDAVEAAMRRLVDGVVAGFGARAEIRYERRYPPLVNHPSETEIAATVAGQVAGSQNVMRDILPAMAAEDFAFMLEKVPGAYINVGNGPGEDGCYLHNPHYNFNDDALVYGAAYWAQLVETVLAAR
ncbi:MAG: M20 aminoacylase family protein [Rhodospirillales bacterium]